MKVLLWETYCRELVGAKGVRSGRAGLMMSGWRARVVCCVVRGDWIDSRCAGKQVSGSRYTHAQTQRNQERAQRDRGTHTHTQGRHRWEWPRP